MTTTRGQVRHNKQKMIGNNNKSNQWSSWLHLLLHHADVAFLHICLSVHHHHHHLKSKSFLVVSAWSFFIILSNNSICVCNWWKAGPAKPITNERNSYRNTHRDTERRRIKTEAKPETRWRRGDDVVCPCVCGSARNWWKAGPITRSAISEREKEKESERRDREKNEEERTYKLTLVRRLPFLLCKRGGLPLVNIQITNDNAMASTPARALYQHATETATTTVSFPFVLSFCLSVCLSVCLFVCLFVTFYPSPWYIHPAGPWCPNRLIRF